MKQPQKRAQILLAVALLLYACGYVTQFIGNYAVWQKNGGMLGGTSPPFPSLSPLTCLKGVLWFPYNLYYMAGCAAAVAMIFLYRKLFSQDALTDSERNFDFSAKGTYGTSGWMQTREVPAVLDMVVKTAPQSSDAKDALQGIRDIYVSEGDAGGYFDYARKSGVEGDLTAMSRDSLSFAAARRIYLSGEPASAAKSLRSYLESYPKGYYTADALYCLSDCYLKTGERSRAIETLAALADAGQNQYTHRALKMLAGMTFADERFTEAAAAYRKLADAESTAAGKAEAMNGYVRATIAAGDEERILSMADDVASYTAAGDEAWRASQFAKAGILDRRGDAAAAQKIYKVLSANVKTPEGAESAYRVIESAFRAGDTARAEKLVLDFSDKGTPHAFWLAKSFLVLGDIYVQKGDMFQARATYQSIVDGYTPADDGIVAEAKEKIKKLN